MIMDLRYAGLRLGRAVLMVSVIWSATEPVASDRLTGDQRVLVVRERNTAHVTADKIPLEVLKIRGYSVAIRLDGEKTVLRLGQSVSPGDSECVVTFEEISPETRIARFLTDCPRP